MFPNTRGPEKVVVPEIFVGPVMVVEANVLEPETDKLVATTEPAKLELVIVAPEIFVRSTGAEEPLEKCGDPPFTEGMRVTRGSLFLSAVSTYIAT